MPPNNDDSLREQLRHMGLSEDDADDVLALAQQPFLPVIAVGHAINRHKACPNCGGTNFEVRNYDEIWRDGDVHCVDCGAFVRTYDAG